jgi:outer membrane protein OmpA-like peptidoglycan-associated protein
MIAIVVAGAVTSAAGTADAQDVLKKIKEQTRQKIETRKARTDSVAIERVGASVDSTLEKTGRGVDTVVNRAADIADVAVDKTANAMSMAAGALTRNDDADAALAAALASGRAAFPEIRFEEGTDVLAQSAEPHVARLARLLATQPGIFVLEGHVDATGDDAVDGALSERRAAALKARLVAAGVPAEQLFAMGLGATRPVPGAVRSARMEIARVQ